MIDALDVPKRHEMTPQAARATMDPLFARAADVFADRDA